MKKKQLKTKIPKKTIKIIIFIVIITFVTAQRTLIVTVVNDPTKASNLVDCVLV